MHSKHALISHRIHEAHVVPQPLEFPVLALTDAISPYRN